MTAGSKTTDIFKDDEIKLMIHYLKGMSSQPKGQKIQLKQIAFNIKRTIASLDVQREVRKNLVEDWKRRMKAFKPEGRAGNPVYYQNNWSRPLERVMCKIGEVNRDNDLEPNTITAIAKAFVKSHRSNEAAKGIMKTFFLAKHIIGICRTSQKLRDALRNRYLR